MKSLALAIATILLSAQSFGAVKAVDTSRVHLTTNPQNKAQTFIEITGSSADILFNELDSATEDSTDAESNLGRPVWRTGKDIVCTKYVFGTRKVPTSCSMTIDKKSGAAVSTANESKN